MYNDLLGQSSFGVSDGQIHEQSQCTRSGRSRRLGRKPKGVFFGTDSTDSPDCLPILLNIPVFLLFSFSAFPLFSCWFRAADWADACRLLSHVKTASRIVSYSEPAGYTRGELLQTMMTERRAANRWRTTVWSRSRTPRNSSECRSQSTPGRTATWNTSLRIHGHMLTGQMLTRFDFGTGNSSIWT